MKLRLDLFGRPLFEIEATLDDDSGTGQREPAVGTYMTSEHDPDEAVGFHSRRNGRPGEPEGTDE